MSAICSNRRSRLLGLRRGANRYLVSRNRGLKVRLFLRGLRLRNRLRLYRCVTALHGVHGMGHPTRVIDCAKKIFSG